MNDGKDKKTFRWLPAAVIIFFVALLLLMAVATIFSFVYTQKYKDKIFPGVSIGGVSLGGKNYKEAEAALNARITEISEKGFVFNYSEKSYYLPATILSPDADFVVDIVTFDPKKPLSLALKYGKTGRIADDVFNIIGAFQEGVSLPMHVTVNTEKARQTLVEAFGSFEKQTENARLEYENGNYKIFPESEGLALDYDTALNTLGKNLATLSANSIEIKSKNRVPDITKKLLADEGLADSAEDLVAGAPFLLTASGTDWKVNKTDAAAWFQAIRKADVCSGSSVSSLINIYSDEEIVKILEPVCSENSAEIIIGVDRKAVKEYLEKNIEPKIKTDPVNAKFDVRNGRVVEFQVAKDGRSLDIETSLDSIQFSLAVKKATSSKLSIMTIKSEVNSENVNDLGVKEIIGTGHSNFSGSPKNRRHNISVGARTLHGRLIKPGEEFSLVKTLGEIDASSGYLPELVIKGNKTTPEYGGGLCQIGTTIFRTALASGLPITERHNHSYRVSYYEPAGTDATIYNPKPDLKFKNDTNHSILIQSRIEGNNLFFDFWGTEDGRIASTTKPVIYNIKKPGPIKMVESTELKPGEKKCTENAHNGADAYFDYNVIYKDGRTEKKRFSSHYRPWQAVCLIGATSRSASTTQETALPDVSLPQASSN